jgi:hypothetical protein
MGWLFALCVCGPAFLLIVWITQDDEPDETDDLNSADGADTPKPRG